MWRALVALSLLVAGPGFAAAAEGETQDLSAALEADDVCTQDPESGACSVSLRQLRLQRRQQEAMAAVCHDAAPGDQCYREVQWARTTGIRTHPAWYPGLSASSSAAEFQAVVHEASPGKCPKPCSIKEEAPEDAPVYNDSTTENATVASPCLCLFDVDRTLTAKQGSSNGQTCPHVMAVPGIWDTAYGGGPMTSSALTAEGLAKTFCAQCYLGTISAGVADGQGERQWLMSVLKSGPMEELAKSHPDLMDWCYGNHVTTPFVLGKHDRMKQQAVPEILEVYSAAGINITTENVYFFDDRTENIPPFKDIPGVNARQISCASRDHHMHNMVGYCGAIPAEIAPTKGITMCP